MRAGRRAQVPETHTTAHLRDAKLLARLRSSSYRSDFVLTTSHTGPFVVTRTGS